jgi:N-glycosylase/DNA lyase
MEELVKLYKETKTDIDLKLGDFSNLWKNGTDVDIFRTMCHCICAPQNKAQKSFDAVKCLEEQNLLLTANQSEIAEILREKGVRFHLKKAYYIIAARDSFYPNTKIKIQKIIGSCNGNIPSVRNLLERTVKGWGLKEASHFLRNIGYGDKICILDRHILRQLKEYNVILTDDINLTKKNYLEIEQKMIKFANQFSIPVDALDLLFWYKEIGKLFW